jgi:hypothetical protein
VEEGFARLVDECGSQASESLSCMALSQQQVLNECELRCAKEKQTLKQTAEESRRRFLSDLTEMIVSTTKSEHDSLLSEYRKTLEHCHSEFCAIECPNFGLETTFLEMDTEIQRLQKSHEAMISLIDGERREMKDHWEQQTTAEDDRHLQSSAGPHSGRARSQVLLSIENSIRAVREETASSSASLGEVLDSLRTMHGSEMDRLSLLRQEAERAREIERLEQQFAGASQGLDDIAIAERRSRDEIDQARRSGDDFQRDWERQLSEQQCSLIAHRNEFSRQISQLTRSLSETGIAAAASLEAEAKSAIENIQRSKQAYMAKRTQLERDITEEHTSLATHCERFIRENNRKMSRNGHRLSEREEQIQAALTEQKESCLAMISFYAERTSVLSAHLAEMKAKWDERPSRQCDLDMIGKLTDHLQTVKMQLGSAVMNIKQCRSLLVEQDACYNRQFGRAPMVGIATARARS